MNLSAIISGIILMGIGVLITYFTLGFGLICVWPLILIGFLIFIFGIISPSKIMFQQPFTRSDETVETKRICPNCSKTMPLHAKRCPHCGQKNKYQ